VIMLATLVSRDLPWAMESIMAQENDRVAVYKISCPEKGHPYKRIASGRNEALWMFQRWPELAEQGEYIPEVKALLFVDDDVILPPHAAERLFAVNAPVVYGLTVRRHSPYHWGVCHDEQAGGPAHSYSLSRRWLQAAQYNDVLPVTGGDASCMLIKRSAVKGLDAIEWSSTHCWDWQFARYCNEHGIRQVVATDVKCGHILAEREPPVAIWPEGEGHEMRRLT